MAAIFRRIGRADAVAQCAVQDFWDGVKSAREKDGLMDYKVLMISVMQLTQDGNWEEGHGESGLWPFPHDEQHFSALYLEAVCP